MNQGAERRRVRGVVFLGLGIAIELVGTALLVWQEQDIYTINSQIPWPAWGAMLVGVVLVGLGFARLLRSTSPRASLLLAVVGAGAGALLLATSLAWQLAYGLNVAGNAAGNIDLEVAAAVPLFFVGIAVLTTGISALSRSRPASDLDVRPAASTVGSSSTLLYGPPAAVLAGGVAFLAASAAAAGWLNTQAADVNSLYQYVALELALGGAPLLLAGASSLLRLLPASRFANARRTCMVAGFLVLAAGAATWWWTAPLVYALGEILLGGFLLAGVGLLLVGGSKRTA